MESVFAFFQYFFIFQNSKGEEVQPPPLWIHYWSTIGDISVKCPPLLGSCGFPGDDIGIKSLRAALKTLSARGRVGFVQI